MSILKGLNNKTKLTIYKSFGKEVKLKRYLHGVSDAGTCLLFISYVLEHMDLMRNWLDKEVEMVSVYVIYAVRTVKVWITFCGISQLIQSAVHYF